APGAGIGPTGAAATRRHTGCLGQMLESIIIILGLALFEIVSSVDNAIVDAHVLKTVPDRYRRFFRTWGWLSAVVIVRGMLPFVILWIANAGLPVREVFQLAFSDPKNMADALQHSKPLLLIGGGMYLIMVFLSWLFQE